MIRLTRLNNVELVLNCDLIEHIETTPDTVIALTSGQKFVVRETVDEVLARIVAFRREITAWSPTRLLRPTSSDAPAGSDNGER